MQRCKGAKVQRSKGAKVQRCNGAKVQRNHGIMEPWNNGTMRSLATRGTGNKSIKQIIMSIKLSITVLMLLIASFLQSQITITSNDMPEVGGFYLISNGLNVSGYDFSETGEGYTWDYGALQPLIQEVDTFVSVLSTPIIYQIFFLYPLVSTIASPNPDLDFIPGFEITEAYEYYKDTDEQYHQAGFALNLMGIPLPIKYDDPDVLIKFPSDYGNIDSSFSAYELDIPELGFYSTAKKRKNYVDGWGTLITPFGTFETQRIRSEIEQSDSLYLDTLGIGFPITRQYIEYKWMGQGSGIALLTVREEGPIITIQYQDSIRVITNVKKVTSLISEAVVYPNPCSDRLNIQLNLKEPGDIVVSIIAINGQSIAYNETFSMGSGNQIVGINLREYNLSSGGYLVQILSKGESVVKPVIIQSSL